MAEVLTVLTFKSAQHIVGDGGTQSWVISQRRARRCTYVVCVRHQQGPYKAEGNEPHKHAFLVGKVSGVVPSGETADRFRVEFTEYAIVDGPHIPLNSASPTQYFPSLKSIGIDEDSLHWRSINDIEENYENTSPTGVTISQNSPNEAKEFKNIEMSVFMQAKKLISDHLNVPIDAIEIIVRA